MDLNEKTQLQKTTRKLLLSAWVIKIITATVYFTEIVDIIICRWGRATCRVESSSRYKAKIIVIT